MARRLPHNQDAVLRAIVAIRDAGERPDRGRIDAAVGGTKAGVTRSLNVLLNRLYIDEARTPGLAVAYLPTYTGLAYLEVVVPALTDTKKD